MPRATNSSASRKRRNKWIKQAKGFRGHRSKLYRYAKDAIMKAQSYSYRDRKNRKRTFRSLWNIRINAAARNFGITYSKFINGLKKSNIILDRKVLADIAVNDEVAFKKLANLAQDAIKNQVAEAK